MAKAVRSINDMKHCNTAYEVALFLDGVNVSILGYTEKKTRGILVKLAETKGHKMIADFLPKLTEEDKDKKVIANVRDGFNIAGGRIIVRFTGRTERDVAQSQGKLY